jgi:hypothetical protein
MPVGGAPGPSEWVVPQGGTLGDGVLSITIVASVTGKTQLSIRVQDLSGDVLVDPAHPEQSPNRVLRARGLLTAAIPSSSSSVAALGPAANFRVNTVAIGERDPDEGPVTLSVWTKRTAVGRTSAGRQDLAVMVYLVGDARADDHRLAVALGEAGRVWRAAGIEILGSERARIGAERGRRFERIEIDPALGSDSPALGELLRLSDSPDALAIFLVGDIVTGPGLSIWALSGGIPVPPLRGTIRSGIAVSAAVVESDPVYAGQIIAHEIGHALGLFHTTEGPLIEDAAGGPAQAIHDQIDDSPACPDAADADPADGLLSSKECKSHDAANLMFWAARRGATALTPGQADIARRSPLTR